MNVPRLLLQQEAAAQKAPAPYSHSTEETKQPSHPLTPEMLKKRQLAIMPITPAGFVGEYAEDFITSALCAEKPADIFGPFLHTGELAILFADTGKGKTALAYQIAAGAALGQYEIVGQEGCHLRRRMKTLFLDLENGASTWAKRLRQATLTHFDGFLSMVRPLCTRAFTRDEMLQTVREMIQENDYELVVIDNLSCFDTNNESTDEAQQLIWKLKEIKDHFNITLLLLAHTPKLDPTSRAGLTADSCQGSKRLTAVAESVFTIGSVASDGHLRYIKQVKSRNAETVYGADNVMVCRLGQHEVGLGFTFVETAPEQRLLRPAREPDAACDGRRRDTVDKVASLSSEGLSAKEIAAQLDLSLSAVYRYLRQNAPQQPLQDKSA